MAEAKKCDRCGAFYVEVEENVFSSAIRALNEMCGSISGTKNGMKAKHFVAEIEKNVDLCAKCSKSLKTWFFGKGEEDGESEENQQQAEGRTI
jgi:hypothetical protein